uniref:Putative methyltransferase n=2 Tax=viral metagenome TaxID=1070528 RepID=A0A6M3KKI6_9ZZZZ
MSEEGRAEQGGLKAPFPYFGGKSQIAAEVWAALGDCKHYIEPMCGSCAVLLARPGWDPARHVETVNDADGMIANVWRALQADPDEVARWCDWPVNHADLIARKKRLNLEAEGLLARLCEDDGYFDPKLAGYYIWAASCWIGHGLICPNQRPHLSRPGIGVNQKALRDDGRPHLGRSYELHSTKGRVPHLSDAGMGVNRNVLRGEPNPEADVTDPYNMNIYRWFRQLSERLRHVRVVCGDWTRVCGGNWQNQAGRPVGMFFDPPYSDVAKRDAGLYAVDSLTVAHDVREWCRGRANHPDYRIVLAGYYEEHESLLAEGWRVHRWSAQGGYSKIGKGGGAANRHREALFLSPGCLEPQPGLFGETP